MQTVNTYYANIYVGLREGYSDVVHNREEVNKLLQEYTDSVSYCVTITPTEFIYKDGNEIGVIIGLINYPRFPSEIDDIISKSITIAKKCIIAFKQTRISIVTPVKTIMIEEKDV